MKIKDQVLDIFNEFHAMIEIETRKCLESVLVDNGSDYRELCGIKLEMIPTKTPMLNSATDNEHGN